MLCIVGHVVEDNLLYQGQQWLPLCLLRIIQLLPLLSHFSLRDAYGQAQTIRVTDFHGSTSLWVIQKEFTIWKTRYLVLLRQNSRTVTQNLFSFPEEMVLPDIFMTPWCQFLLGPHKTIFEALRQLMVMANRDDVWQATQRNQSFEVKFRVKNVTLWNQDHCHYSPK